MVHLTVVREGAISEKRMQVGKIPGMCLTLFLYVSLPLDSV